jgi:hypothetical protein
MVAKQGVRQRTMRLQSVTVVPGEADVAADMRGSGFEVDVPAALRRDADL